MADAYSEAYRDVIQQRQRERSQFERVNALLPQLKDALERYEGDANWATVAALCTICSAVDGQDWAVREVLSNPAWSLAVPISNTAQDQAPPEGTIEA